MLIFRIIYESIRLAFGQLRSNKLRTFLSLLGISIGIFCIIAVQSAVDSLQNSIKDGFGELGSDVVVVDVMPWDEDPGQNYWKWAKRPAPDYEDYEKLTDRLSLASKLAYAVFTSGKTVKHKSSSVEGAFIMGTTHDYPEVQKAEIVKGRYFTYQESTQGDNKVILGHKIATELFVNQEPVGKTVKFYGQKFQVIGVLKEEGDNPFNMINYDEVTWVPFHSARKFINLKGGNRFAIGKLLYAKTKAGVAVSDLMDEVKGTLRSIRRLKPKDDDNFALNELSMLNNLIDNVFGIVNIAGLIIGIFALIVGMISVANIMFVSVKERTNIIGIKKALGAKRFVVMLEFLIEAVVLCIVGGLIGLIFVYGVVTLISSVIPFNMWLSVENVTIGLVVSVLVGIISGIIPAWLAARMDPVEAIRQ